MNEEENIVVLTDEEGNDHEFELLEIMELEENQYAILIPLDEDNEEKDEAIILKIGLDENGEEILFDIEDDDEWEMVLSLAGRAGSNSEKF